MAGLDNVRDEIARQFRESARLKASVADDPANLGTIARMAHAMTDCLRAGGTVYLMGNGGSAADAQHIAGELVGRFKRERGGYACVALTTDTSVITSVGNDYGIEEIFVRQVDGLVRKGDIVIGISTSGGSENIIRAVELARKRGAVVLGLSGGAGGRLAEIADICLTAPSDDTPRIQECHITAAHVLCGLVEDALAENDPGEES